jgi:heme exporter protein D
MQYEFAYQLSDELMRSGTRRFLLHHFGWRVWLVLGLLLLVLWPICASDAEGYVCGFFGGALMLLAMLVVVGFLVRNRRGLQAVRRLATRSARCTIGEEAITLENALATSVMKWQLFEKLVRGPDVWLFFLNRQQYFALPADKLAGETGAFVEGRLAAAGAKLR